MLVNSSHTHLFWMCLNLNAALNGTSRLNPEMVKLVKRCFPKRKGALEISYAREGSFPAAFSLPLPCYLILINGRGPLFHQGWLGTRGHMELAQECLPEVHRIHSKTLLQTPFFATIAITSEKHNSNCFTSSKMSGFLPPSDSILKFLAARIFLG